MSARSLVLILAIAVNLFSIENSKPFYFVFFLISVTVAISEIMNVLKLKMIKKKKQEEDVVIDIKKMRNDLEKEEKRRNLIIRSW